MKTILLLTLLFAVGCTSLKPGCFVKDKAAELVTNFVVETAQCKNPDVVLAIHKSWIESIGICKPEKQTGSVADLVCPSLIDSIVDKATAAGLEVVYPGAGCTGQLVKDKVKPVLVDLCKKIPVSEN